MNFNNKRTMISILFIVITALIPRGFELFSASDYFGFEQGVEYLVTKSIIIDHNIPLVAHQGGVGGFFKPAGFNYLLTIPFILANGDPFGGRIFMFAVSIATVLFGYFLTKRTLNHKIAICVSFLLAISPNLVNYAGKISPPFIIPILTVSLVCSIFEVFKKNYKFIYISALIIGLMMNFEMATSAVLFFEFLVILLFFCVKKVLPYRTILYSILYFSFFMLPLLIYDINNNFHNLNGIVKMLFSSVGNTKNITMGWPHIVENRFAVFSWNFLSSFSPRKLISIPLFVLMYLGSFFYIKNKVNHIGNRLFVLIISIIPVFTFILLIFYPGNIVQWWIIQLVIFYCYLIGIVVPYFWSRRIFFKIIIISYVTVLSLAFISRNYMFYGRGSAYSLNPHILQSEPINYIYKDAKGKPFEVLIYAPGPLQDYEYLLWWHGVKYGNLPIKNVKKDFLYVLIQINLDYKSNLLRLKSLNKGIIEETKALKNGFLVQKRFL